MVETAGYPFVLPLSTSEKPATHDDFGLTYFHIPSHSFPVRKAVSISLALILVWLFGHYFQPVPQLASESNSHILSSQSQRFWGPYSPYYSVEEYQPPPNECTITQASTLVTDLVFNTHYSHRSRSTL
jgi:hypothetical protein